MVTRSLFYQRHQSQRWVRSLTALVARFPSGLNE
jgi:hypothetical protein